MMINSLKHLLLSLRNKCYSLSHEILLQIMCGSCDQTHNQNERTAEKDRIVKIPVIAGQQFITSKPLQSDC